MTKIRILILLALFYCYSVSSFATETSNTLNHNEKKWLQKNNIITVAVLKEAPPFDSTDKNKNHVGYHNDLFNLMNKKLDTNIHLIPFDTWKEAFTAAKEGRVNAISFLSYSKQREKDYFIYSTPYYFMPYSVIVKNENTEIKTQADLKNRKIAVRINTIVNTLFDKVFPDSKKVLLNNRNESFEHVSKSLADATVVVNSEKSVLNQFGLKIPFKLYNTDLGKIHIGTHKRYPEVASIIQKGLDSVSFKERSALKNKWFKTEINFELQNKITLTNEEQDWLANQNQIKVGIQKNWFPLNYVDKSNGIPKGLIVDFIKVLNTRLNGKITIHPDSFKNNLGKLKDNNIDAMLDITPSKERKKFYAFTEPYIDIPHVIVSRKNDTFLSLKELSKQTVAIERGYLSKDIIKKKVPDTKFIYFDSSTDAIDAVSRGAANAYVGNKTVVLKIIERDFIPNLKLNTKVKGMSSVLAVGVNKQNWILRDILQKALDSISNKERGSIIKKYLGSITPQKYNIAFGEGRAPYVFDQDMYSGVEIDLVETVLKNRGYLINEVYQLHPKKQYELLKVKNNIDIVAGLVETKDEGWFFSDTITEHENVVVTREVDKLEIKSSEDLLELKVVAWENAYLMLTQKFRQLFNPINAPTTYFEITNQREQCILFFEGKVDAIVIDKNIFEYHKHILKHQYNTNKKYTYHEIFKEPTRLKVAFKDKRLRDDFNIGLKDFVKSEQYEKMVQSYFKYDRLLQDKFVNLMSRISSKYFITQNKKLLENVLKPFLDLPVVDGYKIVDDELDTVFLERFKNKSKKIYPEDLKIEHSIISNNTKLGKKIGHIIVYFNEKLNDIQLSPPDFKTFEQLPFPDSQYIKKTYVQNGLIKNEQSGLKIIDLTQEERNWVKKHPIITVNNETAWAPFNYNDGLPKGYSIDYIKELAQIIGINVKFETQTWSESLNKAYNKKLDVVLNIVKTPQRQKHLLFTKGYISTPNAIVAKANSSISRIEDLFGKTLAVQKDFFNYELIKKRYPQIKLYEVNNTLEGLKAIQYGKADGYIDLLEVIKFTISKYLLSGLEIKSDFSMKGIDGDVLHIAVRNDYPILRDILQKAMNHLDKHTIENIKLKWFSRIDNSNSLAYNTKNLEFNLYKVLPIKEFVIGLTVFILIILILWRLYIKESKKDIAIKGILFFIIGGFLFLTSIVTIVTLHNLENNQKKKIQDSLTSIIKFTKNSLDLFFEEKFDYFSIITKDSIRLEKIINIMNNKHKYDKEILDFMNEYQHAFNHTDFYILSQDMNVVLSSNENLVNKTYLHQEKLLSDDFDQIIIVPFKNDKVIQNHITIAKRIYSNNELQGYILMDINPNEFFIKIFNNARLGSSGETYGINSLGQLITTSRFESELRKKGLLKRSESSFLNLEIKTSSGEKTFLLKEALKEKSGVNVEGYKDYRDIEVYGTWFWDKKYKFAIAVELDKQEAMGTFSNMKKTLIIIVFFIVLFAMFLTILIAWISSKSKKSLEKINTDLNKMISVFDENIIASKTDKNGIITYASEAFCQVSGFSKEELIGSNHNIIRHPDIPKETFEEMWKTIKNGEVWKGELKNKKKNGGFYWVSAVLTPEFDDTKKIIGYSAIRHDITARKEVEDLSKNLEKKVEERTFDLNSAKKEIEKIYQHTKDSIEYASLIQHALISQNFNNNYYFGDSFAIWEPKDIVGGDIYLFEELKSKDACLLMVIDCTGHGVPGAFVTMLVKAIEREIISKFLSSNKEISPARMLEYFNTTMKKLLKQEKIDSISNAGFDGGILYYDRKNNFIKYAGANTPLFYIQEDKLKVFKSNRHSIGYKKSDINYTFDDFHVDIDTESRFYISTDGYFDQCGGDKGFPFNKKNFEKMILEHYPLAFEKQKSAFLNILKDYMKDEEKNDDITIVGIKILPK